MQMLNIMAEENKTKKAPEKEEPKKEVKQAKEVTYIMNVGHLPWGFNKKNHFFAEKKPLISKKVMGKYASDLEIWLKKGWIKEGSYK